MMARIAKSPRTRDSWSQLGQRLRCWLVRYASVAAITMELLSEKPASPRGFDRPPLVAAAREAPNGDGWDASEILEGRTLRVILLDAPDTGQTAGSNPLLYQN